MSSTQRFDCDKLRHMARMNSRQRKAFYPVLVARDGEFCQRCGKVGNYSFLVIDHIDNNNLNNELDNLQFLCRGCNHSKNPRGKSKQHSGNAEVLPAPTSLELYLREQSKPVFEKWLGKEINRYTKVEFVEVLNSGAKVTGRSQITIRRWLEAECSSAGLYQVVDVEGKKYVQLKQFFSGSKSPSDKV